MKMSSLLAQTAPRSGELSATPRISSGSASLRRPCMKVSVNAHLSEALSLKTHKKSSVGTFVVSHIMMSFVIGSGTTCCSKTDFLL